MNYKQTRNEYYNQERKQQTRNEYRNQELHVACVSNEVNENFKKMISRTWGLHYFQYVKSYDAKISGYYDWTEYSYRVGKLGTSKIHYYIFRYRDEATRDAHRQELLNYYHDPASMRDFRILQLNKGSLQIQNMFTFNDYRK